MCGACGEHGAVDWARPFLASVPARGAVAGAVKALARPGLRVQARPGGWLVSAPTGRTVACAGLTELADAVRPWVAPGSYCGRGSGAVTVPEPDARRPVRIHVDPSRPEKLSGDDLVVSYVEHERHLLAELARPPWSLRCYLAPGREPDLVDDEPANAADLLVWLALTQPEEAVVRGALAEEVWLDIEIRAGHVVRACARR
ncbi:MULTISPECIES: hypothetical protein [Amycolatopsis]|uniref:Uncharacterized protein n=2 Tax=Amycolatopsis TaxID=1813 RepID=A0A1I4CEM3_9PSEU|nr:hypothetical protein [Amycolatopsis sacchari]SFK79624.1 hypothetical protein SAMN05421835_13441 [Amycolatopsis sacchari]